MVIAWRGFRSEEYFEPKRILEQAGVVVKTASVEKGIAKGTGIGSTKVDLLIGEINPLDFDAVIFVGGPQALQYLDNQNSYRIIRETVKCGKILAAICISPTILAKSGVLQGKKATVWYSAVNRQPIEILKENGANFVDQDVVQDGNIITANGPGAAKKFGKTILEVLH